MENLQYPIGRFVFDEKAIIANLENLIEDLRTFPARLIEIVENIPEEDYSKTYRNGGWTIRQLVHHLADSHTNMLVRVKSALATNEAKIMGYDETKWAIFTDNELPLEVSLSMISSIHAKISHVYNQLNEADWQRSYFHSGDKRLYKLIEVLGLYVWHGNHHLEHIKIASRS